MTTLPPPRRDCTDDCAACDLGDACLQYVPPGSPPEADDSHLCPYCGVASWSADICYEDDAGNVTEYSYRECPKCHHIWVP